MDENLYLRPALYEDEDLLLRWANNSDVRRNSFHSETITPEEHRKWFSNMMQSPKEIQYILMRGDTPVGQIRLSCSEERAEIDYSIDRNFRGNGYGKRILELIKQEVIRSFPEIKVLVGKVKQGNTLSENCFADGNYEKVYSCFEFRIPRG